MTATELRERAMNLAPEERADLARDLLLSLEAASVDPDVDATWEAEILRRADAYERGETSAIPWREAVENARNTIRAGDGK
jgi:putative addiction module component (TIGR02574 family)